MIIKILIAVLIIAAIGFGIQFLLIKTGKLQDKDGDNIADDLEDKFEDIKEDVEEKINVVKAKVRDVVEDVKEEVADVVSVIKGKPTKAKLNSLTKEQLVNDAKVKFGVDLDMSSTKSNLVNKVYALYNK